MQKTILLIALFCVSNLGLQAQFLKKFKDKVQDDIINKVSDKIADKLAEDIANRAYKPLDEAFEESYKATYSDSLNQGSDNKVDYGSFLTKLNAAPEKLPDSYQFDVINHMEIEDEDGKIHNMKMYFPKGGDYFGMETIDKGKESMLVYDLKNEIIAMYQTDKGKKKVNVMPAMFDVAGAYVKSTDKVEDEYTFEKTGKTKTILGFKCDQYKVESEKYLTYAFVTKEFPITWQESFGKFIEKFAPSTSTGMDDMENSMTLVSETTYKKDTKKKTFSEVTKVDQEGFTLQNSDYEKVKMGQE